MKHHELRKFPITPNQMRLPRLRQTVRRLVERPMANPRQIRRTRENGQRQTLLHKPPRHHAQPHSGRSYHLPDNTPKDWHTWGEGYMYPIYEPCIPTILNVLEKATPDNPLPNKLVEKCALALFRTDTNWAESNPTKREVLDLWEQQMPCIREQFLKRAYAVLHEALILTMPTMKEEPEVSD